MITENRIQKRYKKIVTRTKRYAAYVPANTVMIAPPFFRCLRTISVLNSWYKEHKYSFYCVRPRGSKMFMNFYRFILQSIPETII